MPTNTGSTDLWRCGCQILLLMAIVAGAPGGAQAAMETWQGLMVVSPTAEAKEGAIAPAEV